MWNTGEVGSMKFRKGSLHRDERAQVGIGTMIVFIATVLVAAIAAGVLISTSSDLQERSSRTGNEATEQVSSNLALESVLGRRTSTASASLDTLEIYLVLAPGAADVDISEMRVQVTTGTSLEILKYDAGTATTDTFSAFQLRDVDGSFTESLPVMTSGDLVVVSIDLNTVPVSLSPRESVKINLIPEVGHSVQVGFTTPGSFGTNLVIPLR